MLYLMMLAIALRWTLVEYKYTKFVREWLGGLFTRERSLDLVWRQLIHCPFCNGCWAGYVVFLAFKFDFSHLIWSQILEFWLFSLLVGYLSLISEAATKPLLVRFEVRSHGTDEAEH